MWRNGVILLVVHLCLTHVALTLELKNYYHGCYSTDNLVRKVSSYKPSAECFKRCLTTSGRSAVTVAGGMWCGCKSEQGELQGTNKADCLKRECYPISLPKCECHTGDLNNYDKVSSDLANSFIQDLPRPHHFKGYNCVTQNTESVPPKPMHVVPGVGIGRMEWCITEICHARQKKKYGAYMVGLRCGCKRDDWPYHDRLMPVTPECADKMLCIEVEAVSCMCGDEGISPTDYSSADRVGPLFKPNYVECRRTYRDKGNTYKFRLGSLFPKIALDLATPADCIQKCKSSKYAAMIAGGKCACRDELPKSPTLKFQLQDCDQLCWTDGSTPCGGPYSAAVYTTREKTAVEVRKVGQLFKNTPFILGKDVGHKLPAYEGCYGVDKNVRKLPEFRPSEECLRRCQQKGWASVAVGGGMWCGCATRKGEMGGAVKDCSWKCKPISYPKCECFKGDPSTYNDHAEKMMNAYILALQKPHSLQGFDCAANHADAESVGAQDLHVAAKQCLTQTCHHQYKKKYGAYLDGYKCGCKMNNDAEDDTLHPVTADCVAKMTCLKIIHSACLCGNEEINSKSYSFMDRAGPLFRPDSTKCYKFRTDYARKHRYEKFFHSVEKSVLKNTSPRRCISQCSSRNFKYAGFNRDRCSCQNSLSGGRKWTNADCSTLCVDGSSGCGGPYAASVYSTRKKQVVSEVDLERLLDKKFHSSINKGQTIISTNEVDSDKEFVDKPPKPVQRPNKSMPQRVRANIKKMISKGMQFTARAKLASDIDSDEANVDKTEDISKVIENSPKPSSSDTDEFLENLEKIVSDQPKTPTEPLVNPSGMKDVTDLKTKEQGVPLEENKLATSSEGDLSRPTVESFVAEETNNPTPAADEIDVDKSSVVGSDRSEVPVDLSGDIKVEGDKKFEEIDEEPMVEAEGMDTLILTLAAVAVIAGVLGLVTLCCFIRMRKKSDGVKKPSGTKVLERVHQMDEEDEEETQRRKEEKRRRKQERRKRKQDQS